jgi:hypothetical protein
LNKISKAEARAEIIRDIGHAAYRAYLKACVDKARADAIAAARAAGADEYNACGAGSLAGAHANIISRAGAFRASLAAERDATIDAFLNDRAEEARAEGMANWCGC